MKLEAPKAKRRWRDENGHGYGQKETSAKLNEISALRSKSSKIYPWPLFYIYSCIAAALSRRRPRLWERLPPKPPSTLGDRHNGARPQENWDKNALSGALASRGILEFQVSNSAASRGTCG